MLIETRKRGGRREGGGGREEGRREEGGKKEGGRKEEGGRKRDTHVLVPLLTVHYSMVISWLFSSGQ